MAQSTQERVYYWDPMTKFFENFFKVVPSSRMACSRYGEGKVYKTQSQGKVYFWWHHNLSVIATKIKICYCLLDTGGHSYIQYFMSLWFICQLDTKTYNYITKNSKIDPKNSKNGDIFFKISSNIYLKKYRIHWFLYVFFC